MNFLELQNRLRAARPRRVRFVLVALCAAGALQACAPRAPYRPPPSPLEMPPSGSPYPRDVGPSRSGAKDARTGAPEIRSREPAPLPPPRDSSDTPGFGRGLAPPPPPDDGSLIAKITPETAPRRAASIRLTDEGRRLLEAGDYPKALDRLEKTIAIDSTNPYGYYYLAKAHHRLGRHRESLNFLDVAESRFGEDAYWLAEVYALRGENYRALGFGARAQTLYSRALQLNPANRTASEALARMQGERQPARR